MRLAIVALLAFVVGAFAADTYRIREGRPS
jgi:hypothetical protein